MSALAPRLVWSLVAAWAPAAYAVLQGHVDDFESLTTQEWRHGANSPNPPQAVADGGPSGIGDAFLLVETSGTTGAGGRLVVFNRQQWSASFAGVRSVDFDARNLGDTPLYLRIALIAQSGSRFSASSPILLPVGSGWRRLAFPLESPQFTLVQGSGTFEQALSAVAELRILSAQAAPSFRGDFISGTLGLDNISAVPPPSAADVPLPAPALAALAALLGLAGARRLLWAARVA